MQRIYRFKIGKANKKRLREHTHAYSGSKFEHTHYATCVSYCNIGKFIVLMF